MSRLIDATICPDCRAPLDRIGTCTSCGLQLKGPLAAQLWTTMVSADGIVEQLRAVTPLPTADLPVTPVGEPQPLPLDPGEAPRRRLPAASVPLVLLSLGAVCLLVAAIVFVAVTWSLLGLTGRTLVLLGITGLLAGIAVVVSRRDLRFAAETFWVIVASMLAVDLFAAQSAGLAGLDALPWRGTAAMVGGALFVLGAGVARWAHTQPVQRLVSMQAAAVVGALTATVSNAWLAENPAVGLSIGVPVLAAGCALLRRTLPGVAYPLAALAGLTWLGLLVNGWDRALETDTMTAWWSDGRGWPLLVAAGLALVAVLSPQVPDRARSVTAGLVLVPLVLLANAPASVGTQTRDVLLACATLVVLALVTRTSPILWARASGVLTALGVLGLGAILAARPWITLADLPDGGDASLDLTMTRLTDGAAPWTDGVVAVSLVVALAALVRFAGPGRHNAALRTVGTLAASVAGLGALALLLSLEPPLWAGVLAAALAAVVAAGTAWWSRDETPANYAGGAATAYLGVLTLVAAAPAHLLSAIVATVFALTLAVGMVLRDRLGSGLSPAVLGALAAVGGGYALVEWGFTFEADAVARALVLGVYAGLVGLVAAPVTRSAPARLALEAAATGVALVAVAIAPDDATSAMVLTVVGTAICAVAVTNRDRAAVGWLGAGVLGVATVLRVEIGVSAPELYTLPAAALLLAAGLWRLWHDTETSSFATLGSGTTLALLPSLLLALDEPVSLRGALIGVAAVLVLAFGVQQRLAAPFILGAGATAVLALRHLGPIAEAVPRWTSLGLLGLALLAVGVTWESRLRNLRSARGYLTALR